MPTAVISPFARRNFVDSTQYETVSIDTTIEQQYGLTPLSQRDARANAMFHSYTFSPTDLIKNN